LELLATITMLASGGFPPLLLDEVEEIHKNQVAKATPIFIFLFSPLCGGSYISKMEGLADRKQLHHMKQR